MHHVKILTIIERNCPDIKCPPVYPKNSTTHPESRQHLQQQNPTTPHHISLGNHTHLPPPYFHTFTYTTTFPLSFISHCMDKFPPYIFGGNGDILSVRSFPPGYNIFMKMRHNNHPSIVVANIWVSVCVVGIFTNNTKRSGGGFHMCVGGGGKHRRVVVFLASGTSSHYPS